ncbi:MAG: hypothetical protein WBO17_03990 [Sphingorhabdus sp.]
MTAWLLVAHIAVLGYWLGSELVINSTYKYVSYSGDMPFGERARLMDHVMHVDQHVRYALVLQAGLGFMLAISYGFIPGGDVAFWAACIIMFLWLGFVELVHRLRHKNMGMVFATVDRASRYMLIAFFLALAFPLIGGSWPTPLWMRVKFGLFAGIILCGVGIRFALIEHFRTWKIMATEGVTHAGNDVIKRTYVKATSVLALLWIFIAAVVIVSIWKPV